MERQQASEYHELLGTDAGRLRNFVPKRITSDNTPDIPLDTEDSKPPFDERKIIRLADS